MALLTSAVQRHFGDIVFTPADKAAGYPEANDHQPRWPTPRQLTAVGKRVVFTNSVDYGATMSQSLFFKYGVGARSVALWSEWGPGELRNYPDCSFGSGDAQVRCLSLPRPAAR